MIEIYLASAITQTSFPSRFRFLRRPPRATCSDSRASEAKNGKERQTWQPDMTSCTVLIWLNMIWIWYILILLARTSIWYLVLSSSFFLNGRFLFYSCCKRKTPLVTSDDLCMSAKTTDYRKRRYFSSQPLRLVVTVILLWSGGNTPIRDSRFC